MDAFRLRLFLTLTPTQRRNKAAGERPSALPFCISVRSNSGTSSLGWFNNVPLLGTLSSILDKFPQTETLELCCTEEVRAVIPGDLERVLRRENSGRIGLQAVIGGQSRYFSPLQAISRNQTNERWFDNVLREINLDRASYFTSGGQLFSLGMRQYVAFFRPEIVSHEMFRGNVVLRPEESTPKLLEDVLARMGEWFLANEKPDGSVPYKYLPSLDRGTEADNPIRRFMAAIAINRLGQAYGRRDLIELARRNLDFNLKRFFRKDGELGMIFWDGSVKLGAVALAGLAILESPYAEAWGDAYLALDRTVEGLRNADGSFRSFAVPADRNDNQNFYPGEALLFQASQLKRQLCAEKLKRTLQSLWWYRDYHRNNRNPAFVPWHSQAANLLFEMTGDTAIREYVFEMNDWLLPMQQWGGDLDRDLWGRFYSPEHPEYGVPHASSTGVYMEGLADALKLAEDAGVAERAVAYETALWRGLRSIAQLQFRSRVDAFYVAHPRRVLGGVRTDAYNNEIRVDNIQHALMGLLKFRSLRQENQPRA